MIRLAGSEVQAGVRSVPRSDTSTHIPTVNPIELIQVAHSESSRPVQGEHWPQNNSSTLADQELVEWHCNTQGLHSRAIATNEFIDKSKEAYNSAWLAREIVQNFVDHNPIEHGTLNGVSIKEEVVNGLTRFSIKGNWTIEKTTGLVGLQSKKRTDKKNAGGNGIGLKQVAIRLMRDFGVNKFQIQGKSWNLDYQLIKANAINKSLENASRSERVEDDWLVGNTASCIERDDCAYIIETDNPELINALKTLKDVGVCNENPYLDESKAQSVFHKENKGKLLWLPLTNNGKLQEGRLFVNGQVMSYQTPGLSPQDFWTGTEGVSIRFDDMDYEMNIDRPPISSYKLKDYLDHIFSKDKEEIITQLQATEYIWGNGVLDERGFDSGAAKIVIEKLISKLRWDTDYKKDQFQESFGNKKYLAYENGIADDKIKELKSQGYLICPRYFADIGMPTISTALSQFDQAVTNKPSVSSYANRNQAEQHGIRVTHEALKIASVAELGASLKDHLGTTIKSIKTNDNSNIVRIYLNTKIETDDIFADDLSCSNEDEKNQATKGQNLLHYLRGVIFNGLKKYYFDKAILSQGEYVVTHDTNFIAKRERLVARNTPCTNNEGTFIELSVNHHYRDEFIQALSEKSQTQALEATPTPTVQEPETKAAEPDPTPAIQAPETKTAEPAPTPAIPGLETKTTEAAPTPTNSIQTPRVFASGHHLDDDTIKGLRSIDVNGRDNNPLVSKGQGIIKDSPINPDQQDEIDRLEQRIPGISQAITELDKLLPQVRKQSGNTINSPVKAYVDWRHSDEFYGQLGLDHNYLNGKSLAEIISEATQARVDFVETRANAGSNTVSQINSALRNLINRLGTVDAKVEDDFRIVTQPSSSQLGKLSLLRNYVYFTTGYVIPNDLFLYAGTGSYGINIGQKAIGLNEALLNVNFDEAVETLLHEIAHNRSMHHSLEFRNALERIITAERICSGGIIGKLVTRTALSPTEKLITEIRGRWEELSLLD